MIHPNPRNLTPPLIINSRNIPVPCSGRNGFINNKLARTHGIYGVCMRFVGMGIGLDIADDAGDKDTVFENQVNIGAAGSVAKGSDCYQVSVVD